MQTDVSVAIVEPRRSPVGGRLIVAAAGAALLCVLLLWVGTRASSGRICPDFIQFWTAARLLASGRSPYDPALQAAIQHGLGWSRQADGLGLYDFLPYYYPPWLGLICVPLLPLGYVGAQVAWLAINAALLAAAAFLARTGARETRSLAPVVLVLAFAPCVLALLMGQVSLLVLAAAILAWRLLERQQDRAAGVALAWLTIKPQLTIVVLAAVLLWCARRGRWSVIRAFVVVLAALVLVSTWMVPGWAWQMATATRVTRLPTDLFPWTGTTVFTVLETMGVRGAALWAGYASAAVPLVALMLRAALDRSSRVEHLFGLGLIAPFFVVPYARHYDFPILLVPAIVLLGHGGTVLSAALLGTLLAAPYVQLALFVPLSGWLGIAPFPGPQFTFFWIPALIAAAWFSLYRAPSTHVA